MIVAMLRDAGHDAAYALESWRGESDDVLYTRAREQVRAILTDDLDFGRLAEVAGSPCPMIVLLRLDPLGRLARAKRVLNAIDSLGDAVDGKIAVIEPGQVRLRTFADTR